MVFYTTGKLSRRFHTYDNSWELNQSKLYLLLSHTLDYTDEKVFNTKFHYKYLARGTLLKFIFRETLMQMQMMSKF